MPKTYPVVPSSFQAEMRLDEGSPMLVVTYPSPKLARLKANEVDPHHPLVGRIGADFTLPGRRKQIRVSTD
jgi:hypothetical protein